MTNVYEVDLYEGKELVTYKVRAKSPEEAEVIAKQKREEFFQQDNTKESLTAEMEAAKRKLSDAQMAEAIAPAVGVGQAAVDLGAGAVDSVLNMAEGVVSIGSEFGWGQDARAKLQEARQSTLEMAQEINAKTQEWVTGGPLTEEQKAKSLAETAKFVKRGKFATDALIGVATGAHALRAPTFAKMVGLGGLEGGLGGYLMADSQGLDEAKAMDKRIGEAALGGALGTGLAVVPGVLAGAKNWLGRKIVRAAGGEKALKEKLDEMKRIGIDEVTPGQITGDADLLVAERQAAGSVAQEMLANQQAKAAVNLGEQIGVSVPPFAALMQGSRGAMRRVVDGTFKTLNKMRGRRNKAINKSLEQMDEYLGSAPITGTQAFVDKANQAVQDIANAYGPTTPFSPWFRDTVEKINAAHARGGLSAKEANGILNGLTRAQKSGRGIFDTTSPEIAGSLETYTGHAKMIAKDLKDELIGSLRTTGPGAHLLDNVRAQYGKASQQIAELEDAFKSTIGLDGGPAKILKRLEDADPDAARELIKGLRQLQGGQGIIDDLNSTLFKAAVNAGSKANVSRAANVGDFNTRVFLDTLMQNTEATRFAGLLTPQQEKNLAAAAKSWRRLFSHGDEVVKTHLPFELQNIAINVISRDPGFMARMVGAVAQRGKGAEALFFTKEGQEILFNASKFSITAGKTGAVTQGANATIAMLASMLGGQGQANAALDLADLFGQEGE